MTRSTEKLIHAALRDGCREHCDALIDELRRSSAENEALRRERDEAYRTVREAHEAGTRVVAQRDELLYALRTLLSYANVLEMRLLDADGEHRAMQRARAAIKMAEEEGWVATVREAQKHFNEELKRYEGEKE